MMEEELEVCRETIHKILVENLGERKICAGFIRHSLTDEQKALRLQASQEFFFFNLCMKIVSCLTQL
jgi:hypothetical protein